jgi:hypothetical protein
MQKFNAVCVHIDNSKFYIDSYSVDVCKELAPKVGLVYEKMELGVRPMMLKSWRLSDLSNYIHIMSTCQVCKQVGKTISLDVCSRCYLRFGACCGSVRSNICCECV